MAFRKDKTGSAQTAANASAALVAAFSSEFKDFDEAVEAFHKVREDIFADLAKVVDADNELFAEADAGGSAKSERKSSGTRKSSGSSRGRKTGGGRRGGSGGKVTLEDALEMKMKYGAFEGESLGTIVGLGVDECDDDYGYGDGERDGRDYIAWLAGDSNENEYVQKRAQLVADEENIDY